jgi:oligopeptide/dipeptide ABC transporter ATP-binding protein
VSIRPCHPTPDAVSTRIILEREIADPANPPPGCAFHPRCRHAIARCRQERPALEEAEPGRWVACLRAQELALRGVSGLNTRPPCAAICGSITLERRAASFASVPGSSVPIRCE